VDAAGFGKIQCRNIARRFGVEPRPRYGVVPERLGQPFCKRPSRNCVLSFAADRKQLGAVAKAQDMHVFRVFIISATAILLPAFAAGDPMRAAANTNTQAAAASADAQALSQATTPASATPAQSTTMSGGDDPDQIVCKDMPARTGSRIGGGRECHTQREWRRLHLEARDFTRLQRRLKFLPP
jgi:hypothetical protein